MTFRTLNQPDAVSEKQLREGAGAFRDVVAGIQDYAICLLSPGGVVLTWNAGARRVTGYADRDIIGQSFERFYTPEARAAGRPRLLLETARARGRVEDVDWRMRKDGTRFWADVVITARRENRGQVIGFTAITRDLTTRPQEAQAFLLRAGQELTDSLDYETTLQQVVHQAVPSLADVCFGDLIIADSSLQLLAVAHVNPAKEAWLRERMRDQRESQAPALRVVRTGEPLILPAVTEDVLCTIAAEEHLPVNHECVGTVNELGVSSAMAVPLVTRNRILGVLTLLRLDGSAPFGPHDQLLLPKLARQCALALDNARLYRDAQEAVLERDELLATTSHELRRPLSEIKGFASTLLREDVQWDEPTGQDFLQEIDRQADLLDTFVNDLLEMSSVASSASQHFDRAPTPPAILVRGGVDRVRSDLAHRVLDIDPDLDALPTICVDARRINQVFANLVENAIKYAPGSPIRVAGRVVNWGRDVELWVEDEGPGIHTDDLSHIFDKFYRGQSTRKSEVPGTGLGLAITQAIVEAHGGDIRAENRPGGGARFVVRLPVAS